MKYLAFLSLFVFSIISFSAHAENSLDPVNPDISCDEKLDYAYYSVCYSINHRQAYWTAHWLTRKSIDGPTKRRNSYRADFNLADPVGERDYRDSGFDRGHLVPAGDMKLTRQSMSETFYMTNMSPQRPNLNRRIWNNLENGVRDMVRRMGNAYVITAPVLRDGLDRIFSGVSIPNYYYKVVYFPLKDLMRAYLLENRGYANIDYSLQQITVDELEELTGFDFFSGLDDELENKLESELR